MTFDHWKKKVGHELAAIFGWPIGEGLEYIRQTAEGWREMFDDGLSPEEAAREEAWAAAASQ